MVMPREGLEEMAKRKILTLLKIDNWPPSQ
jgi:hypothetical protein